MRDTLNKNVPDNLTAYQRVLHNYQFTSQDIQNLENIELICANKIDDLFDEFYEFIFKFEHAKTFLHDDETLSRHTKGIRSWYLSLFSGEYNQAYFDRLAHISEIHVRIGLPAHYVNAAFSFIRRFIKDILLKEKRIQEISSWDKIIDINIDALTLSYREEEQAKLVADIAFIRGVVASTNVQPYMQPIFAASTNVVKKYECLMRLINSTNGSVVSVFPYLALTKTIHCYETMMKIMIDKSFAIFQEENICFSVNIGYEDICNSDFKEYLIEKVECFPTPENITFEILESDFIEDFNIVVEFSNAIRKLGCTISIDDFGSGYSSMENILMLKPDFIKIDASLIKNIDISQESQTIVRSIVSMAQELGAKTIAEFVHTEAVNDMVVALGVDYLQGFYLGEPNKDLL